MGQGSIGIFDSGVGGLTVMREVVRQMPYERVVYFGDTARVPYGGRSGSTIERYAIENTIFLIDKKIKILLVACNTASAYAVDKLRKIFRIPIVDVIDPSVKEAVDLSRDGCIAVLGTKATIASEVYQDKIRKFSSCIEIHMVACPLFVPLVEEGFVDHKLAKLAVEEYLRPLKKKKIDTVILGCTHYPLLENLIVEELGRDISIVNAASCCAVVLAKMLKDLSIEKREDDRGKHQYFVSDDPEGFRRLGEFFLGDPIERVDLARSFSYNLGL